MTTFSQQRQKRKQKLKQQNIEEREERLRLKALPKVLRQLETELGNYVDFMEVYDGYLGEFTGQIIPAEPVGNPFAVLHKMDLNFPHPNSLSSQQKKMFIDAIKEAFNRMMFDFETSKLSDVKLSHLYDLLLFHISTPNNMDFDSYTSINYNGITLIVKQYGIESDYFSDDSHQLPEF
jgi:hypothetical protein